MSSIKISDLPNLTTISSNTSNTLFMGVDIPTKTTGKFTATLLSQQLYANNVLNVGTNQQNLPNTIAQFSLSGASYIQTNLVNTNDTGTADIVVTANTGSGGTDSTNFIDMGWANKNYQAGAEYNNIGNAVQPNDGYLYSQGTSGQRYGNLIVGTTSTNGQLKFIVGGGQSKNIIATMTSTGLVLNTQSYLTFSDGTIQTTAAAPLAYSQAAFAVANTANTLNQIQIGIDVTQNTNIGLAWNKANNALANATGTFGGDLTLAGNLIAQSIQSTTGSITTGNLIINGTTISNGTSNIIGTLNVSGIVNMNAQVVLTNTSFSATQAALTIAASNTVILPANDGYMIHISGKNGISSRIVSDSYGTGAYAVYAARTARGTVTSPTAVQNGDIIGRFSSNGYGTTKFQQYGTGRIDFVATENYTDANTGSQIQFWNCPVGTNTLTQIAVFNGASVTFAGTVQPQKGFIYTPTLYPGAQTAITIDFANNSLVRAQTATGITVTLSNLLAGKEVVAWITNTAGTNQTFTHGVSATNSTVNATTYAIPGTSTILVRYMSIDGTLTNTFVAITHA